MITAYRTQLPISITTILRDYPFTCVDDLGIIRKTVLCETDIFFYEILPEDQLQLAATIALLSARLSNQTAMIIVRTSEQAKKIYNYVNYDGDQGTAETTKKTLAGMKIASTFSKFKGNSHPLAANKLIITSYNTLTRNLLYRKSRDDALKAKVQLPIVNAYIFIDPFDENKSLNRARKSWISDNIDSILLLLPQRDRTHVRRHFISAGLVPAEEIERGFNNIMISTNEGVRAIYQDLKEDALQNAFLRFILFCLYSGSPSKKQLIEQLQKATYFRIYQAKKKKTDAEMTQHLTELIFHTKYFQNLSLFESLQEKHLGAFALVKKDQSSYSRFTLTTFGRQYLIASTYFEEMLNDPMMFLRTIRKKTENDIITWELVREIFSDFTRGKLQFDDLQFLIGKLDILKDEEETIASILSASNNCYVLFQITRMLNCFRDQMTQDSRESLKFLNRVLQKSYDVEESPINKKMDRQTFERALKELLANTEFPITQNKICSMLIINAFEAKQAIQSLNKNRYPVKKLTIKPPKGRSHDVYTSKNFPAHFKVVCGDCHWYEKRRCMFWRRTINIAERKVSSENYIRATKTLRGITVGCKHFMKKEKMTIIYSVEEFYDTITRSFVGFSADNKEIYAYLCSTCLVEGREIVIEDFGTEDRPAQGLKPVSCSMCNTTFKLIQKRKKTRRN